MTPDFTAEANKATGSPLYPNSPAEMLARRMFAQGMRYVRDEADLEAYDAAGVEEEATLIENGGKL